MKQLKKWRIIFIEQLSKENCYLWTFFNLTILFIFIIF